MTRFWAALVQADLFEEIGIVIALALIAVGFWWAWRPGAFLVPGLVILWLVLPTRRPFVVPPDPQPPAGRKSS